VRLRLLLVLGAAAVVPAALAACGGGDPTGAATTPGAGGGAVAPFDGGTVDAPADGPAALADAADAAVAPVLVAITPNPRNEGAVPPGPDDVLAAEVDTIAAGARAVVLTRPMRDLDAAGLAGLSAEGAFFTSHGQLVVLNITMVDRAADGRPDALAGKAWDDPASFAALHDVIDGAVARLGTNLAGLTFGRDVDVYLAKHPSERPALRAFAAEACGHARQRVGASAPLGVGVAFSFEGATTPDPSFAPVLAACSAAVLSYMPGLGGSNVAPASAIAGAVDAMIGAASGKPIVLQALGYPSASLVGASPDKQALFFQTFFEALAPRRRAFALVDVFELHDLGPNACAALASAQGESPSGPFALYACSTGLHAAGDQAKPAWLDVLAGIAQFAAP
jgi:hypothetical protein